MRSESEKGWQSNAKKIVQHAMIVSVNGQFIHFETASKLKKNVLKRFDPVLPKLHY